MIPDYTLEVNTVNGMAKQIAAVIQWTKDSISSKHKGNPNEVFITGHSSTGTLGRIGRHESLRYGIEVLKYFWNHLK
jgi:hypothetical protein